MKNLLRNIIKVLDSQPGQRRGARGQSLVELTLTAPILFIMIISAVEVGYLANNYLILLDAVREGGRFAVTETPLNWAKDPTVATGDPETRNWERTDCNTDADIYNIQRYISAPAHPTGLPGYGPGPEGPFGFFDGTACQVVAAMNPLNFDLASDDIVVSAVGFANRCSGTCYDNAVPPNPLGTHMINVTGRWPLRNRTCTDDSRDPFNIGSSPVIPVPGEASDNIRGFIMTGNQKGNASNCIGSKFHIGGNDEFDLENRFNSLADPMVRNRIPNGGMVIVEMTWRHHQLFHFPGINLLGDPVLYIWMMFPVTAAEPTATAAP